jgi:hypothetical protein
MKKLSVFCLLLFLSFVFYSCLNPTLEDTPRATIINDGDDGGDELSESEEEDDESEDNDTSKTISYKSFVLDAVTGLISSDTETNAAGKPVATLTVPETDGPWTPELVEDAGDNALFELINVTKEPVVASINIKLAMAVTGQAADQYEIRIKDSALSLGDYSVILNIRNGANKVYNRTFTFSVTAKPPPFKKAPTVHPYITTPDRATGQTKTKLVVEWDEQLPKGAEWAQVYVGTSANSAEAQKIGDHITGNTKTMVITDITGDGADGYLPDATTYYVWLSAGSDSLGEGQLGPVAACKTSDTIDPYWWTDIDWWDVIDSYEFYFNDNDELVIGYNTRGVYKGKEDHCWVVRYHFSCDPVEFNHKYPRSKTGHDTTNEDLTGAPAGVFIVEWTAGYAKEAGNPFYAVYYWGHKTIQTGDAGGLDPVDKRHVSLKGTIHSYLSNAYHNGSFGYKATLKEAIKGYIGDPVTTKTAIFSWVAWVAVPWYPVKNGRYKYGTPVQ